MLGKYIEENSDGLHEDGCPEDDTCDCPTAMHIQRAFDRLRAVAEAWRKLDDLVVSTFRG